MKTYERISDCEQLVMKTVWDADEKLSLMEIMDRANKKYCKEWKPTTVSTFLARLVRKGYLKHYRKGRVFFYKILIPLDEYKAHLSNEFVNFWNRGNADEFLSALSHERPLRTDEVERIEMFIKNCKSKWGGDSI